MKSFLLVLVLSVCQCGRSYVPSQILLSVYYESKCSDCIDFINDQLVPAVDLLEDHLILELVPFGKAHSINDEGYDDFECQHGPEECTGNLVQDCTLNYMQGATNAERVSYVACEMNSLAGTTGNLTCVRNTNVREDDVRECANSHEGTVLQQYSEEATKLISPEFIPTVVINNVFNQQIQDQAIEDLTGTLCSLLKEKVQCCAARYNQQAITEVLL